MKEQALYELMGEVKSFSNPKKKYSVKKNVVTGAVSCDCPAWIFQRGAAAVRSCKHVRMLFPKVLAGRSGGC